MNTPAKLILKRDLRYVLAVLLLAVSAIFNTATAKEENSGARGGCDPNAGGLAEFPRNSIVCLRAVVHGVELEISGKEPVKIGPIRTRPDFQHLEINIQETRDHQLIVYGGRKGRLFKRRRGDAATIRYDFLNVRIFDAIRQVIAERTGQRSTWKSVRVADLTLAEIKSFFLEGNLVQRAPSLAEYLSETRQLEYDGKLMVNVGELHSEPARTKLLNLLADYDATGDLRNPGEDTAFHAQHTGLLIRSRRTQNRVFGPGCASELFRWWSNELRDRNVRVYRTAGGKPQMVLPDECGN